MENKIIDAYGLIGYPLTHSFSERFFSEKFKNEHIQATYSNFEIKDVNQILDILKQHTNIKGFNVTIPHKQAVIALLSQMSDEAREIGAVNVVRVSRNGDKLSLKGFNSDALGFVNSIAPLIATQKHKKALVLGTGGASKAVMYGLKKLGLSPQLVSRNGSENILSYNHLNEEIITSHTVIVNCTPLGTFPKVDELPLIPYCYLTDKHLLYDLVYNPPLTAFLKQGEQHGATIKNGAEMLELQALAAWDIWNESK